MLLKTRSQTLYKQLYPALNQFEVGDKFFAIRFLQSKFRVSRRVVDCTLRQFVADKLLEHREKEGYFIVKHRKARRIALYYNDWVNGELPQFARFLNHEFEQLEDCYQFDAFSYDYRNDLVPILARSTADVLIVCLPARPITREELSFAMTSPTPVIFMERNLLDTPVHCTFGQYELGTSRMVDYLIQHGHSNLAILPAEPMVDGSRIAAASFCGFARLRGCRVVEIPCVTQSGNHSPTMAYEALKRFLEQRPVDFSALFVIGEYAASGALKALKEHEIRVPQEVSVTAAGFALTADRLQPPLTTVGIDPQAYSRKLAQEIHRLWSHFGKGARISLAIVPEIIERESVRSLKQSDRRERDFAYIAR